MPCVRYAVRLMFPRKSCSIALALLVLAAAPACSLKNMAVKSVAGTLSETGDVFTRDDDPDLVREATPFALKLYESLLESVPNHVPLLTSTCGAFTQNGYAFLESEADAVELKDRDQATLLRERALKHYLRGRKYCLHALDVRFGKGTSEKLLQDPVAAVAKAEKKDVALLYWSAASWGSAISLGIDKPEIAVDFPSVRALADRALALDADWGKGAIHELMITLDSLPEALGGNADRAREHFKTAVSIQKGLSPGPYVSLALGISVPNQNRSEYEQLLKTALAIDPEKDPSNRLVILLGQKRARVLLQRIDEKFSK